MQQSIGFDDLQPGQVAITAVPATLVHADGTAEDVPAGSRFVRADAPEPPEPDELRMSFTPVLNLASWTYRQHDQLGGHCIQCGIADCLPWTWAQEILTASESLPYLIVAAPRE